VNLVVTDICDHCFSASLQCFRAILALFSTGVFLPVDTISVAAENNFTEKRIFFEKRNGGEGYSLEERFFSI
jgi:hypothetical protein